MNKFKDKTAIAIISYNREDFFKKCVASLDFDNFAKAYVVISGDQYKTYPDNVEPILCSRNPTPVGIAKNAAIRKMRENNEYDHLFLLEDDIEIIDNNVFEKYILTAYDSGIYGSLSYASHGGPTGGNISQDGIPNAVATVKYTNHNVQFFPQSLAAFTYFHSNIFKYCGMFNEQYINAAEHLDHYVRIFNSKLGTPFFWFPDIENSHLYIKDIDANHEQSSIRNGKDFTKNFQYSWALFKSYFKHFPHEMPKCSQEQLLEYLNVLEDYARKDLL